jgi:anti-sigma factor (TIGR02949 family)
MNLTPAGEACDSIRARLDSYVDHELIGEARDQVRRHLDQCPACTSEVEARTTVKSRLRTAVRAETAPAGLTARVRLRIQKEDTGRGWWRVMISPPRWAMAVALIAVVAGAVWLSEPGETLRALADRPAQNVFIRRVSNKLAAVLKPGLADHLHCAVFRKYPANPPDTATMIAELGPYADLLPAVTAVIPKTWHVIMAHRCSYQGRKFVHLTMRDGERLVSLIIARREAGESFEGLRPAQTAGGTPIYEGSTGTYQVAAFQGGDYAAYLVSDMSGDQLIAAARKVSAPVCGILARNL